MSDELVGAAMALGTACCWCFSAMAFEGASRIAGSVPVNLLRLVAAFVMLAIANLVSRGMAWPLDATAHHWKWLLISGLVGFFVGDATLFRAFVLLGARLSTLIACTAPIFTLAAELLTLPHASLSGFHGLGILITVAGIGWVVLERHEVGSPEHISRRGIILAIIGAAGQGVGAVLTAMAFEPLPYPAFAAGQIRMLAGIAVFTGFVLLTRRVNDTISAIKNPRALSLLCLGAFWGPFLGVSLFIQSLKYVRPSTTQTLSSLVPVLIIPFTLIIRRERVSARAFFGACLAVAGVWLLIYGTAQSEAK